MANIPQGGISLGVGQPDFDTPEHIREGAKLALDQGYTRYPPSKGFADLRQAISEKLRARNHMEVDPESQVFISVGAMQGIFTTMLILIRPGDEVIVFDPGFIYNSQIRAFGGVPVPVPLRESNGFRVDPDDLRQAMTPKTRLIILNTPSNPTGAVFGREVLLEVANIAKENGVYVLSDEAYEDILFEGEHCSIGSLEGMMDRTVSVFTFSKSYAMTGWRVGYVVARPEIISEMEKLMEHLSSGVTAVSQKAALAALQGPQDCVAQMAAEYRIRRDMACAALDGIPNIGYCRPQGAFYLYLNIAQTGMHSEKLVDYLITTQKVGTVPATAFSRNGKDHIRICFALDRERLLEGIGRIKTGIERLCQPDMARAFA